jgi:hypothetical protein
VRHARRIGMLEHYESTGELPGCHRRRSLSPAGFRAATSDRDTSRAPRCRGADLRRSGRGQPAPGNSSSAARVRTGPAAAQGPHPSPRARALPAG